MEARKAEFAKRSEALLRVADAGRVVARKMAEDARNVGWAVIAALLKKVEKVENGYRSERGWGGEEEGIYQQD